MMLDTKTDVPCAEDQGDLSDTLVCAGYVLESLRLKVNYPELERQAGKEV